MDKQIVVKMLHSDERERGEREIRGGGREGREREGRKEGERGGGEESVADYNASQ